MHRLLESHAKASHIKAAPAAADESRQWFDRAKRVLAGGISSSARSITSGSLPHPIYIERGHGSHIWDVDGNEYVDFLLSYGSIPLGHADPALSAAVANQLELGTMFGTCNVVEVELAEQLCRMVPSLELVRFANSGSEAMSGAIRAARGYTGKSKVLKFEGHYHGWVDVLAVANRPSLADAGPFAAPNNKAHSRGTPAGVVDDVIICPWNEPDILAAILDRHQHELAAVVAEPIVANNACVMPAPGYLEALRSECTRRGIVLIFDEIVTGFRVAAGGAQELFGVPADLTVFSKALGGGFPISAFGGSRRIMDAVAANTVKHGGTYNGNPLCAAAALHTLRTLADPDVRSRMNATGESLVDAIRAAASDHAVPCVVQGLGTMFQVVFGLTEPAAQYRDLFTADTKRYATFHNALLRDGVHANSSGLACWFTSAAHTQDDVDFTAAAIRRAIASLA